MSTGVFDLPQSLVAKADPASIAGDERRFTAIAESLEQQIAGVSPSSTSCAGGRAGRVAKRWTGTWRSIA